jgi:hypothetical protein
MRWKCDGKGGRLMSPLAFTKVQSIVLAVLFVMSGPMLLHAQTAGSDLVFETPSAAPSSAVRQVENALATSYAAQSASGLARPAGKTNVTQTSGTTTIKSARAPIPGTDPKGMYATGPSVRRAVVKPLPAATPPAQASQVVTVSHNDPVQGVTADGGEPSPSARQQRRALLAPQLLVSPADRKTPPVPHGSIFGLRPGETATERLLQMQSAAMDLERENEAIRQQNAELMTQVKESQEQLMAAVREIRTARKELGLARGDLDRLRGDLLSLREKVRLAEKEHSAVLQSMGPLLQQLLESDEVGALPPRPME